MSDESYRAQLARLQARRTGLARDAFQRGQAALATGDQAAAAIWLDRARRIAPDDATIAFVFASLRLQQGDPAAAGLFTELIAAHDTRAAWLGLVAARQRSGDVAGASDALAATLSAHAGPVDTALQALAAGLVRRLGLPGWCAARSDLTVLAEAEAMPRAVLDGRALAMPPGPPWIVDAAAGARLELSVGGRGLLGSPIDLARIRRVEGFVRAESGGIEGWAWHPANPERDPVLRVLPADGDGFALLAEAAADLPPGRPLARPRRIHVPAARLAALGPVRVLDDAGADLLGSPLDPGAEQRSGTAVAQATAALFPARPARAAYAAAAPASAPVASVPADLRGPPPRPGRRPASAAVIIPAYRGLAMTMACLDQVFATVPEGTRIVVVDDAGPEPALAAALDTLAAAGRIRLIRNPRNRGFPASANAGLRATGAADAVLLNSDTLVAPGWLERLGDIAWSAPDIGTVTPLSNDATILSYPRPEGGNPVPDRAGTLRLAAQAHRANRGAAVEIPVAIGFCMYVRRDCLDATGLLREDVFAQGYGEENDFCLRARHLGWRHMAAPGVFVTHLGSQSFGGARAELLARNAAVLERLHPGYGALVGAHLAADPLATFRRRLDMVRWRADRPKDGRGAVLLITHDRGGGVQRQIAARMAALRADGLHPILLRPVLGAGDPPYTGLVELDRGAAGAYPNLRFALPDELDGLARLLAGDRPLAAELHHLMGHDHAVLGLCTALGIPYDVHIHDYAWFCPRVALVGADRRYCGEPTDPATCEACVADAGRAIEEEIGVALLRARSAADLGAAREIVAPSGDAAARIARHFPGLRPRVREWEPEPPPVRAAPPTTGPRHVCVVGAIGPEKGYDVLLACARDAAARHLDLRFTVVGHTIDDARLLQTGRVFVTGEYAEAETTALIAAQGADIGWIPSIWPETWCFALTEAWRAGLEVVAFDIGAQAERIRRSGRGMLLPLGLPPASVNAVLLRAGPGRAQQSLR